MHFRHSEMTQQSGDSCLHFNIWQRMIKNDTKRALSTWLLPRCPGSASMQRSMLWKTLSGLILIKEAVICNEWLAYVPVIVIFLDILWEGVSVRWSGTSYTLSWYLSLFFCTTSECMELNSTPPYTFRVCTGIISLYFMFEGTEENKKISIGVTGLQNCIKELTSQMQGGSVN